MQTILRLFLKVFFLISILSWHSLIAQVNLKQILIKGKVHENGKGIAGVCVTDGRNVVASDSKGNYRLQSNATARFIYITIPSGYNMPERNGVSDFFVPLEENYKSSYKIDFSLIKMDLSDQKHAFMVLTDPQVSTPEEFPVVERVVADVKKVIDDYQEKKILVHALVCGDIVFDRPKLYDPLISVLGRTGIPLFYAIGNHDMTYGVRSDELSTQDFEKNFGPTYYSFNRGMAHYVVLDDVFYVGRSTRYIAYLTENQLEWLRQDLSYVKIGSPVFVTLHIPTYTLEAKHNNLSKELMQDGLQNRDHLYQLLKPFQAHILAGHTHYSENFILNDQLFEHVQGAICGVWYQGPTCSDGSSIGYGVYEVDGEKISWYYKSVGHTKDFQMQVYPRGAYREDRDAVVVNVWGFDSQWKVCWYENGQKKGEMQNMTGFDPLILDYLDKNRQSIKYKWIEPTLTDHLFIVHPESKTSSIKIEATDRFGNVYTRNLDRIDYHKTQ